VDFNGAPVDDKNVDLFYAQSICLVFGDRCGGIVGREGVNNFFEFKQSSAFSQRRRFL